MSDTTPDQPSYEEAREELIEVVRTLEAGGTTLEESLALWERGEALAKVCQQWLDGARKRLDDAMGAERRLTVIALPERWPTHLPARRMWVATARVRATPVRARAAVRHARSQPREVPQPPLARREGASQRVSSPR